MSGERFIPGWRVLPILALTALAGWCVPLAAAPRTVEATLKVGDPAPAFQAGRWLVGGPLAELPAGKTVVLVFGRSAKELGFTGLSRLDAMQEKLKGRGILFVGVRVYDHPDEPWEFPTNGARAVSLPVTTDPLDERRQGILASRWLEPAGELGLPVVFVVNKERRIAWIGHPFGLAEKTLLAIDEGTYDLQGAARDYAELLKNEAEIQKHWRQVQNGVDQGNLKFATDFLTKVLPKYVPAPYRAGLGALHFQLLVGQGRFNEAVQLAAKLAEEWPEEPHLLNLLAWELMTNDDFENPDQDLILKIAERANAAAYGRDAPILDTYARALFLKGRKEEAIRMQEEAVRQAPESLKPRFAEALFHYRRGQLPPVDD